MKILVSNPTLRSWLALNAALRNADEKVCRDLLQEELKGRNRKMFIKRIHSRLNKARADHERLELGVQS